MQDSAAVAKHAANQLRRSDRAKGVALDWPSTWQVPRRCQHKVKPGLSRCRFAELATASYQLPVPSTSSQDPALSFELTSPLAAPLRLHIINLLRQPHAPLRPSRRPFRSSAPLQLHQSCVPNVLPFPAGRAEN